MTATDQPTAVTPGASSEEFEESPLVKIRRLERQLADARRHAFRATQHLHRTMVREIKDAERRAKRAEKRATAAEVELAQLRRRARVAEQELAAVHSSTTWRAGRAVVAVPARLKRLRG